VLLFHGDADQLLAYQLDVVDALPRTLLGKVERKAL
jgi:hypothetical protein